jgi:Putative Flp pilus-assembly TadE/G-like
MNHHQRQRRHGASRRRDSGQVTAFVVALTAGVLALAGLVLDAGLAVSTKVQTVAAAQSAARAGARELDVAALRATGTVRLDPVKARTAAQDWLYRAGLTGTVTVTGNQVLVSVTTSQPTQLLHLLGVQSIPVTASATADAVAPN